ncbi:MAG TPA: hypothetical protein VHY37_00475, partial [Tepidisphaeraceae bacterium]|nr:hypothetical protein [Tepidisphaeraceae bacterium]
CNVRLNDRQGESPLAGEDGVDVERQAAWMRECSASDGGAEGISEALKSERFPLCPFLEEWSFWDLAVILIGRRHIFACA